MSELHWPDPNYLYCPGDANCSICKGEGMVRLPGGQDSKQCICAFTKNLRRRLGDELATCRPVLHTSPLYEASPKGGEPVVDLTSTNLFIKCRWRYFKPHFRLAAMNLLERSSFIWNWQFVTDERIKSVFVGNEAYVSKSRKKREDSSTFNGLSDLLGQDYNLIVIRLGFLGYANRAMAGALKEALLIRESLGKTTWVLEEPNSIFGPGHFSWSAEVAEYISARYKILDLVSEEDDSTDDDYEENAPRGVAGASARIVSEPGFHVDGSEEEDPLPKPKPPPKKVVMPPSSFKEVPKNKPSPIDVDDSVLFGKPKWKR